MASEMHVAAVRPREGDEEQARGAPGEIRDADHAAGPLPTRVGWLAPVLAVLAILLWSALFVWAHAAELTAGVRPALLAGLIREWSVPVLLVLALRLLAMRYSRREEARFAAAAQVLGRESALLGQRLERVNRELVLAREAIAGEATELESLGRVATERLGQHAERLQQLIRGNVQEIEAADRASTAALGNMKRVQEELPAVTQAAQGLAGQIAQAGDVAQAQLAQMSASVAWLAEAEQSSEERVAALREHVALAIGELGAQAERLSEIAEHRFADLAARAAAFRAELDAHEAEALEAMRGRADALHAELAGTRREFDATEKAAVKALANWLTTLRERATQMLEQLRANEAAVGEAREAAITAFDQRMRETIEQIAELDRCAMNNAHARLAALAEEAERIDQHSTERLASFEAAREQRELEAAEREAGALVAMRERLGHVDELIAAQQQAQEARLGELEALAASLEQRIALARTQAEERMDDDFARRMTQITESLHSAAIDLTRVLATDISDSAWESYLRGDRGIFTRQAVRLLERREARSIAQLHAEDESFRHAVNRYIGDFEAMLRDVLATREGHRLGVTLLSSDAGKLYVALAQAIERLRN